MLYYREGGEGAGRVLDRALESSEDELVWTPMQGGSPQLLTLARSFQAGTGVVRVQVDPRFWRPARHLISPAKEELRGYCELWMQQPQLERGGGRGSSETRRTVGRHERRMSELREPDMTREMARDLARGSLKPSSLQAPVLAPSSLRPQTPLNPGLKGAMLEALGELTPGYLREVDVDLVLHGWLLQPFVMQPLLQGMVMGRGNPHGAPDAGPPSFYIGWGGGTAPRGSLRSPATGTRTTVLFVSDCYDRIPSPRAYQQCLLVLCQSAVEALLTGLSSVCYFCLCSREFVQFGIAQRRPSPKALTVAPITRKLDWRSLKDRKRMAEMSIGICYWVRNKIKLP
ncbi:hypothetical protein GNI_076380 [Gregarina niphandrodes]|uniref:Uncharacterized protein n=1 Tax=Gregarina niphandrodes TaxID=110365 RepID=A0A023B6T8_GRENI|nr:hypothetical protein GNI_076380 [Gregarina niphandrodes]EZG66757.1 hypothetical protein GNI_076380 [Gregarina niphandrodes]|eukprot:XP_011130500.1 hypothetical protein GNI_076380 [Gregarina niphandrodes]